MNSAVSSVSASCSLTPRAPGVKPEKRNSGWGTFPTTREREKYRLPQAVRQVLESCPAVGTGNDGSDGVTNWKSDALWEDDCISESVCARNPTAELLSIQAHPPTTPRGWCGPGAISQYNVLLICGAVMFQSLLGGWLRSQHEQSGDRRYPLAVLTRRSRINTVDDVHERRPSEPCGEDRARARSCLW